MHIHFAVDKFPSFNTIFGVELNAFIIFFPERCAKNAVFNGNVCKCKKGFKGNGFKKCIKSKTGRDLEEQQEEEKRDVTDEGVDVSENGLERA